jgi:hypothetical protein
MDKMQATARRRYLHQSHPTGQGPGFRKQQIRNSSSWNPDWSLVTKHCMTQIDFANYLDQNHRPQAMAILNSRKPLHPAQLRTQLQSWRNRSSKLHLGTCPPRHARKIEFIASLEYGFNPRKAPIGRIHAHLLLYNLGSIRLDDLGELWRKVSGVTDLHEPVIKPYQPGPEGILYTIKAYGSDADMIYISPKLALPALVPGS